MGHKKIDTIRLTFRPEQRLMKNYIDDYPFKKEFAAHINTELGFTIRDLKGKDGAANREVANLHFYAQLEKIIDQKHKEQGFKFD